METETLRTARRADSSPMNEHLQSVEHRETNEHYRESITESREDMSKALHTVKHGRLFNLIEGYN